MWCSRWIFLLLVFVLACTSQEKKAREEPLLPAETFNWGAIPLTFQPPPAPWARQKHNQGGLLGVWFTHRGSVGERIYVAEYTKVGKRSMFRTTAVVFPWKTWWKITRFSTEGWPIHPDSFVIQPMVPDTVAGMPAYRLDFTLHTTEQRSLVGRGVLFSQEGSSVRSRLPRPAGESAPL